MMLRVLMPVGVPGIFFLDVRRIGEHQGAEVACAGGAEDSALEALRDEPRQVAAVVEVGVGEDDRVDARRVDRQRLPVPFAQLLEPLEQPAVDQHTVCARLDQIL